MTIEKERFGRNAAINLAGQLLPALVGLASIPLIVAELGRERFGLLALAWTVLSYFTLFDLGLGLGTIRFVSQALARDKGNTVSSYVWTSAALQAGIGVVAASLLAGAAPWLAKALVGRPEALREEAQGMFLALALSLPFSLVATSFRAILLAHERFGLVALVRAPLLSSLFLLPLLAAKVDWGLVGVGVLLTSAYLVSAIAYYVLSVLTFREVAHVSIRRGLVRPLLGFGGWVTASNALSPILANGERFFLGINRSVRSVAYYVASFELAARMTMLASSLFTAIFPVFSSQAATSRNEDLARTFGRAARLLLLSAGSTAMLLAVFGNEFLGAWLGSDFGEQSSIVLPLLAVGFFANSLAFVPLALLQSIGRPDVSGLIHLAELPVYLLVAWPLTQHLGIEGAALAWSARATFDALLLLAACVRLRLVNFADMREANLFHALLSIGVIGVVLITARLSRLGLVGQVVIAGLCLGGVALFGVLSARKETTAHWRSKTPRVPDAESSLAPRSEGERQ